LNLEEKKKAVEKYHPKIPVKRQCELLSLSRSALYYKPKRNENSRFNEKLMRLIDKQYTATPFYGVRRMTAWLNRKERRVNRKRIARLMRKMGLYAVYPKPKTSTSNKEHKKYPYLLKDIEITRPNQVWATDITYIRLKTGFIYLTAIMDWSSRYVLSWKVSTTLDTQFCLDALDAALALGRPEIFNSDQGVQFTSLAFTEKLLENGIAISMDGKGRVFDNIFVERLWRSLKYEEIYLNEYETVKDAIAAIAAYFRFYNEERPHQALEYKTPLEVWSQDRPDAPLPTPPSLSLSGCLAGEKRGEAFASPASISPVSALGSLGSRALSSGRDEIIIPQRNKKTTPIATEPATALHKEKWFDKAHHNMTKQLTFTPYTCHFSVLTTGDTLLH